MGSIKELWNDAKDGDICAIGLFICFTLLGLILSGFIFVMVDRSSNHQLNCPGSVINKYTTDGYYTTTYITIGETLVPQTTYYPPTWNFMLSFYDYKKDLQIEEESYSSYSIGQKVKVFYVRGILSDNVYPVGIEPIENDHF